MSGLHPPIMYHSLLAVLGLGWREIIVILILVTVLFGAKKLPLIARGLASVPNQFRKGRKDGAVASVPDRD